MIHFPTGDRRVDHGNYTQQIWQVDGTSTVVYHAGSGDPLVYFHGAGTWHGISFAELWPADFSSYLPYHPGFGASSVNPRITSMQGYVDHYERLFDLLGFDQVNLVGTSLGGFLAAEFAARHSNRVKRLVLACPAGLQVERFPATDLSKVSPDQIPAFLVHDTCHLTPYLPEGEDAQFAAMRRQEAEASERFMHGGKMINPDMPSVLQSIQIPTLIIWGKEDRILPVGQAEFWHQLIPQSEVKVVGQAGHLVLDESATARHAVSEFLLRP